MTRRYRHLRFFAGTIAVVAMSASLATAGITTQYSFEGDLLDSGADGLIDDNLTDEESGGGPGLAGYVDGVVGQAASIDGLSGVLVTDDSDDLDLVGNFTIDLFINPTSYQGHWNRMILKWGTGHDYHLSLRGNNPDPRVDLFDGNVTEVIAGVGPVLTLEEWHHVGISNDASDLTSGLKTYVDGDLVDETAGITLENGTDPLGLGNAAAGFSAGFGFTGLMDEVRFHDEAQDAAYMAARYVCITSPGSCGPTPPEGIPGDINESGTVDRADVAEFVTHYGATDGGDFDQPEDGLTDLSDLAILQQHFGETTPVDPPLSPAAVPEPSTMITALIGLLLCGLRRTRNHRSLV